jgi:hypothetical protein
VFPIARRFYTDGRHVTVAGAKLKAKLFADFIVERHLIPHTPVRVARDIEVGRMDGPTKAVNGRWNLYAQYLQPGVQVATRSSEDR